MACLTRIKKIAVLRANQIGDYIFSLPALTALKKTYPVAEIVYFGKQWHHDFLKNRPGPVDRVIVIPKVRGVGMDVNYKEDAGELADFFSKIRKEKFDLAIQMHGGGKFSNPFLLNFGAKKNLGFKDKNAIFLDISIPYVYYNNEYLRYLELVSYIGAYPDKLDPNLSLKMEDLEESSSIIKSIKSNFIVLHPGATDIKRRWPAKYFSKVGDYLFEKGYRILITGSSGEKEIIEDVAKNMKHESTNLCGRLSINGLTGLLSKAFLVFSNDTGPLHLAYALKTPIVGIFWVGNLINGGPVSKKNNRCLISWTINCPLCGENCSNKFPFEENDICNHKTSFVADIKPEEAILTLKEFIKF